MRVGKRGASEVDIEFLKEIEEWRDTLARHIAHRNEFQSTDDLSKAVQLIIDRIVFLRMAEDRGVESYERLRQLAEGSNIYENFIRESCRRADEKYNSGLFDFRSDKITPRLAVDDKVLRPILLGLYFPQSPYEFRAMPVEILGSVYERFLGKTIRLTKGGHAKVEEKPAVRKAGGVYYTPSYIVKYIVQNTLGKLTAEKSPAQIAGRRGGHPLHVLDMACGSGSFLLGAYQCLLDHCLKWYIAHHPGKFPKAVWLANGNGKGEPEWRLTIGEKKRILIDHIFGVDIDAQAVEVTKLSLLLKVLEGENDRSLGKQAQLELFEQRALPNLDQNIKCGNSLIGPDCFSGKILADTQELKRINPFDWSREFPEAMRAGGFDCVIGNPPWGADSSREEEAFYRRKYQVAEASVIDSYSLFIEGATTRLKKNSLLGYIVPDTFLRKDELMPTRKFVLLETIISELLETGPLFSQVRDTWCLIIIAANAKPKGTEIIHHKKISRFIVSPEERLRLFEDGKWFSQSSIPQSDWQSKPKMIIGYKASRQEQSLISKLEQSPVLGQLIAKYKISRGEEGSKFDLFTHASGKYYMLIPADIERYMTGEGVRVPESQLTKSKVEGIYRRPKIWIIRIQKMRWKRRLICAFDPRLNSAGMKTLQVITSPADDCNDLKYLAGILCSNLMNFWCENYLADDMNQSYLSMIPIRDIDANSSSDKAKYQMIVRQAECAIDLRAHYTLAKSDKEKDALLRQIAAADAEIDHLVYDLYGLTDAEIALVEGGA